MNSVFFVFSFQTFASELNLLHLFKPLADIVLGFNANSDKESIEKSISLPSKLQKYSNIFIPLKPISHSHFIQMMVKNGNRFNASLKHQSNSNESFQDIENVINALCHPNTVRCACELYLKEIEEYNRKK